MRNERQRHHLWLILLALALLAALWLDRGATAPLAAAPAPALAPAPTDEAADAPAEFVPTEKLPPGSAISFPVDI